jgi:hypothetical protein
VNYASGRKFTEARLEKRVSGVLQLLARQDLVNESQTSMILQLATISLLIETGCTTVDAAVARIEQCRAEYPRMLAQLSPGAAVEPAVGRFVAHAIALLHEFAKSA